MTNEPSSLFNIEIPNNPEDPMRGFVGSDDELPVENRDTLVILPTFNPGEVRLIFLKFTTRNVRKVIVYYLTSRPNVQNRETVSESPVPSHHKL